MSLVAELRSLRHHKGWSQRELADQAGVPQSTVGRIEAELISPRLDTLELLASALGVDIAFQTKQDGGIDRTQIRQLLRLSPQQRIENNTRAAKNLRSLERKMREGIRSNKHAKRSRKTRS